MFSGTNNIFQNISIYFNEFYEILLVPTNTIIDMNNVMTNQNICFQNHKIHLSNNCHLHKSWTTRLTSMKEYANPSLHH